MRRSERGPAGPVDNRNLEAGARLVARYKGKEHTCDVVKTAAGELRFVLKNGKEFKSPSAAGREVAGGTAINGWRFWSVDGANGAKPAKAPRAVAKKKAAKKAPGKKAANRTATHAS